LTEVTEQRDALARHNGELERKADILDDELNALREEHTDLREEIDRLHPIELEYMQLKSVSKTLERRLVWEEARCYQRTVQRDEERNLRYEVLEALSPQALATLPAHLQPQPEVHPDYWWVDIRPNPTSAPLADTVVEASLSPEEPANPLYPPALLVDGKLTLISAKEKAALEEAEDSEDPSDVESISPSGSGASSHQLSVESAVAEGISPRPEACIERPGVDMDKFFGSLRASMSG
ncbi:hypothetical protein V5O48_016186, partial [Marasmius crinis-equi]